MTEPTKRQSEYLEFIRAFTDRWKIPPSFDEIGRHFGTTPPSVNNMVKTLEARGFLTRVPGAARTLRVLVDPGRKATTEGPAVAVADAIRLSTLIVERLIPALKGADERYLDSALDAVWAALEVACVSADATDAQRDDAFEALRRTVLVARGMSPERAPGGRGGWSRRR